MILIDEVRERQADTRARVWAEYRMILERAEHPADADTERLELITRELALTVEDVEAHVAAIGQAKALAATAATEDENADALRRWDTEFNALNEELNRVAGELRAKIAHANNQRTFVLGRQQQATSAAHRLHELQQQHHRLFAVARDGDLELQRIEAALEDGRFETDNTELRFARRRQAETRRDQLRAEGYGRG